MRFYHHSQVHPVRTRCPLSSCNATCQLLFGNELVKCAQTRQTCDEYTADMLTVHRIQRRWSTLQSETTQCSNAAGTQRVTKLCRLQSGERARTITNTENTCSSPRYPVTTDLSHFNSVPLIWCRGPRPKAHWYMHTDGTNYRKCHRCGY